MANGPAVLGARPTEVQRGATARRHSGATAELPAARDQHAPGEDRATAHRAVRGGAAARSTSGGAGQHLQNGACPPPRPRPNGNGDAPLVLVAEDNEVNRSVAQALLSRRGLRTVIARNGLEAVQLAASNDYAAILMDCQMAELDGYEATRRIRAAESRGHVPIIAMTAHSMRGDRERCLAEGMDDYLSKPVRGDELDAVLGRWLRA